MAADDNPFSPDGEPTFNEITISWGDVTCTVRGDQTMNQLEARLFGVLDRLKMTLNGDTHAHAQNDKSFG